MTMLPGMSEEIWYDGITPVRVITQPDGSTLKVDSLGNRSPVDISTLSKSRIGSEDEEVSRGTAAERQNLLLLKPALDSMDKLSEVNDNGVRQDFIMTGATLKNIAALEEEPEYQALLESEVAAQDLDTDRVGVFWALLFLSSQGKVELQQEGFLYAPLKLKRILSPGTIALLPLNTFEVTPSTPAVA